METTVIAVYFVALSFLFIYGIHSYVMVLLYRKHREAGGEKVPLLRDLPLVTIQLPVYNELYVVDRLIRSVCALDYPKDKLEIQVLDDSTDETIEISRRMVAECRGQGYRISLHHRKKRTGYKAGALRVGLDKAMGDYIAIFDADFIPDADFLKRTLPHFADDRLGMVQTRWVHLNSDFSTLTKSQAMGLDGHFVIEQTARNRAGLFINFNGTAGVWRKTCILDAGNWEADTLTEDLDLSYRAQLRGWKFKYLKDTTCSAELPIALSALRSQQFRWTKGAMETAKKILPRLWKSGVPLRNKVYGTLHLLNNMVFPMVLIAALLNGPLLYIKGTDDGGYTMLFALATVFIGAFVGSFLFYLWAQREAYPDWRRRITLFPIFLAGNMGLSLSNTRAVLEGVFNRRSPFRRTPKFHIMTKSDEWMAKKYLGKLDGIVYLEILMAAYCLAGLGVGVYYGEFLALPFQFLFFYGFAFISYFSLKHHIQPRLLKYRTTSPVPTLDLEKSAA